MSVHNAASGPISISNKNRAWRSPVAADADTPAAALIEAIGLVLGDGGPVVVACATNQRRGASSTTQLLDMLAVWRSDRAAGVNATVPTAGCGSRTGGVPSVAPARVGEALGHIPRSAWSTWSMPLRRRAAGIVASTRALGGFGARSNPGPGYTREPPATGRRVGSPCTTDAGRRGTARWLLDGPAPGSSCATWSAGPARLLGHHPHARVHGPDDRRPASATKPFQPAPRPRRHDRRLPQDDHRPSDRGGRDSSTSASTRCAARNNVSHSTPKCADANGKLVSSRSLTLVHGDQPPPDLRHDRAGVRTAASRSAMPSSAAVRDRLHRHLPR